MVHMITEYAVSVHNYVQVVSYLSTWPFSRWSFSLLASERNEIHRQTHSVILEQ